MHGNNREDILEGNLDVYMLSLFSSKIKVGIIGGGKTALIKCKTLSKAGCTIEVLSKDFNEGFKVFSNIKLQVGNYYKEFINDKHLIIIAINSKEDIEKICQDCNEESRIFINCVTPRNGVGALTAQRMGENFVVGVNLINSNPRGAVFGAERARECLLKYDDYFELTSKLRNKIKNISHNKEILMNFISSEDFLYFYENGREKMVLQLFYDKELIENLYQD